jgi:hypothetical protein
MLLKWRNLRAKGAVGEVEREKAGLEILWYF